MEGSEFVLLRADEWLGSLSAATDGWVITLSLFKFLFISFLFLFTLLVRLSGVEGFEFEFVASASFLLLRGGTALALGGFVDNGDERFCLV